MTPRKILSQHPKQLERPLPKGLVIKESEDALLIIRPWSQFKTLPWMLLAFLCSGGMLTGSINILFESFWSTIFSLALLVGGLFGLYVGLTTLVNKTTLSISNGIFQIKHGPIPDPFMAAPILDLAEIKQVYVEEKISTSKGSNAYQYYLYVLTNDNNRILLFPETTFTEWDQALYCEEVIERHLGLSDQSMADEPDSHYLDPLKRETGRVWRTLASTNHLKFVQRSPLKGAYLRGLYRGQHYLELDTLSKERGKEDEILTRLLLKTTSPAKEGAPTTGHPGEPVTLDQVAPILARSDWPYALKGTFDVEAAGQQIYYEQVGVESEAEYLQFLFDAFSDFLEAYPKIVALGGEAVPALQAMAEDETHPFQPVAPQLLTELAQATSQCWADRADRLRCGRCLGRCVDLSVRLSSLKSLAYYACQSCHQSQQFFEFTGEIIAVLDSRMTATQDEQGDTLRINWLARRTLFSFDAVEIVQATDEEAERFAVQVGNDTDPPRRERYQTMSCRVFPDCALSDNTLRILQRTFGQIYT